MGVRDAGERIDASGDARRALFEQAEKTLEPAPAASAQVRLNELVLVEEKLDVRFDHLPDDHQRDG